MRLALFHLKRGLDDHSTHLHKIEQALGNANFKKMSRNQLAPPVSEGGWFDYGEPSKSISQLDQKGQSMAEFMSTVRQTENLPWYGTKRGAKYTGSGDPRSGARLCSTCNSSTNTES